MADTPKPAELSRIDHRIPPFGKGWMDIPAELKEGVVCYGAKAKDLAAVNMPNVRDFDPREEDWKLP